MAQNVDGFVRTHSLENIKQYITYDGDNRMEYVYEARANAAHGEPCLVTQYVYAVGTTRITKMKESVGAWSSTYDV